MTDIAADGRFTDLFNKFKLEFTTTPEQTEFIRTGIETLVKQIVYLIKKYAHCKILLQETKANLETELERCTQDEAIDHSILRVGSFYEGTKNHFPDEFDFILILETFKDTPGEILKYRFLSIADSFNDEIFKILASRELTQLLKFENGPAGSCLRFTKVDRIKGPGVKMKFVLNLEGEKRKIHVDLTPAFKIESDSLSLYISEICVLTQFSEDVVQDKKYIVLKNNVLTFTETEKRFMTTVLSTGHKMVYRILKYLVNGENDGDILEASNIGNRPSFSISTYKIKCVMIHHHYECQEATIDCIPNVLEVLHDCHRDNNWIQISRSAKRDFDNDNVDKYVRRKGTKTLRTLRDQLISGESDVEPFAKSVFNALSRKRFVLDGCRVFLNPAFFQPI